MIQAALHQCHCILTSRLTRCRAWSLCISLHGLPHTSCLRSDHHQELPVTWQAKTCMTGCGHVICKWSVASSWSCFCHRHAGHFHVMSTAMVSQKPACWAAIVSSATSCFHSHSIDFTGMLYVILCKFLVVVITVTLKTDHMPLTEHEGHHI